MYLVTTNALQRTYTAQQYLGALTLDEDIAAQLFPTTVPGLHEMLCTDDYFQNVLQRTMTMQWPGKYKKTRVALTMQ